MGELKPQNIQKRGSRLGARLEPRVRVRYHEIKNDGGSLSCLRLDENERIPVDHILDVFGHKDHTEAGEQYEAARS